MFVILAKIVFVPAKQTLITRTNDI